MAHSNLGSKWLQFIDFPIVTVFFGTYSDRPLTNPQAKPISIYDRQLQLDFGL